MSRGVSVQKGTGGRSAPHHYGTSSTAARGRSADRLRNPTIDHSGPHRLRLDVARLRSAYVAHTSPMPNDHLSADQAAALSLEERQRIVHTFNALRNAIRVDPASDEVARCFEAFAHTYRGPTRKFVVRFAPPAQRRRWAGEVFVRLTAEIGPEVWNTAPPPMPC